MYRTKRSPGQQPLVDQWGLYKSDFCAVCRVEHRIEILIHATTFPQTFERNGKFEIRPSFAKFSQSNNVIFLVGENKNSLEGLKDLYKFLVNN